MIEILTKPLTILLFASLAGSGAALFVWPEAQEVSRLQQELDFRASELESREQYFQELAQMGQLLEDRAGSVNKVDAAVPNDVGLPALYDLMQTLAGESGLTLRAVSVSPAAKADENGLKQAQITLSLGGSYAGVKDFLGKTLTSYRFLDVRSLGFTAPQGEADFVFHIQMAAYSF